MQYFTFKKRRYCSFTIDIWNNPTDQSKIVFFNDVDKYP